LTNADGNHDWIYYRLSAFGRTFHFNVTLNRWLVAPSFRVEYWNADGPSQFSAADEQHAMDCYYVGYLAKQEVTSRVAISNCHGLVR
jgi:a disintegrin and metalloproteinase with thrombospondin motifs 6